MTNRINRSSCAFHAIAASLALCSTPLFAQEVSPAAPPVAAADPAPVVVLPAQSPAAEPAMAAPVEAPIATVASDAPAPTRATPRARPAPAARSVTPPRVAATTAPVVVAAKPLSAAQMPVTPAPSALTPAPEPAQPATAPQPEAAQPADNSAVLELGALAALGIVGLGLFATRRRRTIVTKDGAPVILEPIDAAPAFAMPAFAAPPIVPQPAYATYDLAEPAAENARTMPGHGVSMPDGPVPTGEARQRLIDRMVAAAPDAANPFTSVKGRRHRARLILQARAHEQQQAGQDGFDWRNHPTSPSRAPDRGGEPVADRTTVDA